LPGARAGIAPEHQLLLSVHRPALPIGGVQALVWGCLTPRVRVSELVHIEDGDVDLDACKILIGRGKGAKDRYILFPAGFRLVLKSHLHATPSN
jgi:integrase